MNYYYCEDDCTIYTEEDVIEKILEDESRDFDEACESAFTSISEVISLLLSHDIEEIINRVRTIIINKAEQDRLIGYIGVDFSENTIENIQMGKVAY